METRSRYVLWKEQLDAVYYWSETGTEADVARWRMRTGHLKVRLVLVGANYQFSGVSSPTQGHVRRNHGVAIHYVPLLRGGPSEPIPPNCLTFPENYISHGLLFPLI